MRKLFIALGVLLCSMTQAKDTLFVQQKQLPILIERQDNILMQMRIDATTSKKLDNISLEFGKEVDLKDIQAVKLYYGGTEALQDRDKKRFAPVDYLTSFTPGKTMQANPSYSVKKDELTPTKRQITLKGEQKLFPGYNFFWVSIQMKKEASLHNKITTKLVKALVDGQETPVETVSDESMVRRVGIGVRHAGDDGSAAFRIPGLTTTNKGTLLGVYDVRYNNSADLQEHVDIGLSRSTDGGKTWEKMRLPLTFGEDEGLPKAQNGVGDPAILVDTKTTCNS